MVTKVEYDQLADEFDRAVALWVDAKNHATALDVELPQIIHYAHWTILALPAAIRHAGVMVDAGVAPEIARAFPATIGNAQGATAPQDRHDEPEEGS